MSESYIQQLFADRIGGCNYGKDTAIYKFEKIKRAKRAAMAANPSLNLIDYLSNIFGGWRAGFTGAVFVYICYVS